jgi:hypothetical protein
MFDARVVRILIASPSDTGPARGVLREALEDWNALNAEEVGIALLPVMWERDATPEIGAPPQAVINRQLVDRCDAAIGTFWTRLGSPTAEAESGTVDEINRMEQAAKPVLIYFSRQPVVPSSIDPDEYARLTAFRDSLKERSLFSEYSTPEELRRRVTADITQVIRDRFGAASARDPARAGSPGANLLASIHREREVSGFDQRGNPRYRTDWRLQIENRGDASAEELSLRIEAAGDEPPPEIYDADKNVNVLPAGGVIAYPLLVAMQMAPQFDVVMEWRERGEEKRQVQTLRV